MSVWGNRVGADCHSRLPPGHPAGQLMPWLHSDIKNMAYYHVYPAFTNIVEKGGMK